MFLGFSYLTKFLCILSIMSTSCLRSVNDSCPVSKANSKLLSRAGWKDASVSGPFLTLLTCSPLATLGYVWFPSLLCSLLPLSPEHVVHQVTKAGASLVSWTCDLLTKWLALAKGKLAYTMRAEDEMYLCAGLSSPAALGKPEIAIRRSSD